MSITAVPGAHDRHNADYWHARYQTLNTAINDWLDSVGSAEHTEGHNEMDPDPDCPRCLAESLENLIANRMAGGAE